jgi:hypothetical protein
MSAIVLEAFVRLIGLVILGSLREALLKTFERVHLGFDVMVNLTLFRKNVLTSTRLLSAKWSFVMQVPGCLAGGAKPQGVR